MIDTRKLQAIVGPGREVLIGWEGGKARLRVQSRNLSQAYKRSGVEIVSAKTGLPDIQTTLVWMTAELRELQLTILSKVRTKGNMYDILRQGGVQFELAQSVIRGEVTTPIVVDEVIDAMEQALLGHGLEEAWGRYATLKIAG